MTTFKPGDIVLRTGRSIPSRNIYTNSTYVVKATGQMYNQHLMLVDRSGVFNSTRFKLTKSTKNNSDKQKIIDANVIEF